MKKKPPAFIWLMILLLAFLAVVFTGWLIYRYNMNLLELGK